MTKEDRNRYGSQVAAFAERHGLPVNEEASQKFNVQFREGLIRDGYRGLGDVQDAGCGFCLCCMRAKPKPEFPKSTPLRCHDCAKWLRQHRYLQDHEQKKIAMRARLYDITPEQYHALHEKQGGLCAICGQPETRKYRDKPKPLSIDHDHRTGRVRGLLCSACNHALGNVKDDVGILQKAITYLEVNR